MRSTILSLICLAATTLAAPLQARQDSSSTCGNNYYSAGQLQAAVNQGYDYYVNDEQVGTNAYPHSFTDYEGFALRVDGPYLEFPILEKGVYTGGSPGADRVVFNTNGEYAASVTHTGASGNDFVACSDTTYE